METPKNLLSVPQQKKIETTRFEKEGTGGTGKIIAAFLIGAVFGALGVWLLEGNEGGEKKVPVEDIEEMISTTTTLGTSTENTATIDTTRETTSVFGKRKEAISVEGNNAIKALDQAVGSTAEVTMITLSVPGWVAIHEDRDGALGNILGAARFEPGIHLGEVELLRPMVSGGKYHAVLYQDNGDKSFDTSTDAPIKNSDAVVVESVFSVQ